MGIPKQVLEAERQAEAAIEREQAKLDAQNSPPQKPDVVPSPDEAQIPTPKPDVVTPTPAATPPAPAPVVEDELASLRAERDREKQLRKTLEGRLRSQLKPANDEIRELKAAIADAQETIVQLTVANKKPGAERHLSDEEAESLGDVLDVNTRMVKGVLEESLESGDIADYIKDLVSKSQEVQTATTSTGPSDDFWPLVDQYSPGAREMNRSGDPMWLAFLDMYDNSTGVQNRVLAEEAMQNDDPVSLVVLFDACKRANGIVADTAPPTPAPVAKPEHGKGKAPVVPAKPTGEVEAWTQAEIQAFYNDVLAGKFKGREDEAEKFENQIMAAAQAGLIT